MIAGVDIFSENVSENQERMPPLHCLMTTSHIEKKLPSCATKKKEYRELNRGIPMEPGGHTMVPPIELLAESRMMIDYYRIKLSIYIDKLLKARAIR